MTLRIGRRKFLVAVAIGYQLHGVRRAVARGDHSDVIARPCASVFALIPEKGRDVRRRRRKELREEELARLKLQAKRKANQPPIPDKVNRPTYQIGSWYLLVGGAALMLLGLSLRTPTTLMSDYQAYWWVATSVGVLVFTFGLK